MQFIFVGYRGETSGTVGGVTLPEIVPDASGTFRATFTIPATLGPVQQDGGGATTPGNYKFISKPAYCIAELNVGG